MAGKNLHVIPHAKKWAVRDEGSTHPRSVYATKQEAIDAARDLARGRGATLVVHGRHGQPLLRTQASSKITDEQIRVAFRDGSLDYSRAQKRNQ